MGGWGECLFRFCIHSCRVSAGLFFCQKSSLTERNIVRLVWEDLNTSFAGLDIYNTNVRRRRVKG
jgi:hypothetical protein